MLTALVWGQLGCSTGHKQNCLLHLDISVELSEHSLVSFVLFALVIVLFFQDIRYRLQILYDIVILSL